MTAILTTARPRAPSSSATGVNADRYREVLGINCATAESGAGGLGFFRDMVARGLSGVTMDTSHPRRPHRRDRGDRARRAMSPTPRPSTCCSARRYLGVEALKNAQAVLTALTATDGIDQEVANPMLAGTYGA